MLQRNTWRPSGSITSICSNKLPPGKVQDITKPFLPPPFTDFGTSCNPMYSVILSKTS